MRLRAMKVAVLSDIHANIDALDAVLAEVRAEGIERLILLGDYVGYYFEPRAVIEALSAFDCVGIQGNHDRMALAARDDPSARDAYRGQYGSAIDAALDQLGQAEWDWLAAHPVSRDITLGEYRIHLAHGATFDPDAYIYPDAPTARFDRLTHGVDADAIWLGHTHYPFMRVGAGGPAILNPGSVGQPRDIGGLASWAIFHAETGATAFRRTEFQVHGLLAECRRRDPGLKALSNPLTRKRMGLQA
ncbi:metallophosphoesterase family protein [uncultured Erythrobacter sp.]|uniref:metallophosphoesterase family protein n=1 Tax=uncultured Erythrobacter sp. TaxID=263913 RepID=UPI00261F7034|nr:metallophosphoesterase family protein [uncultured Erythrobacter sp.]